MYSLTDLVVFGLACYLLGLSVTCWAALRHNEKVAKKMVNELLEIINKGRQ